jgi:hypothetical protein
VFGVIPSYFCVVLGFELRALHLKPPHQPFFVMGFFLLTFFFFLRLASPEVFAWTGFELVPPDLCLLSCWGYRCEPPASGPFSKVEV